MQFAIVKMLACIFTVIIKSPSSSAQGLGRGLACCSLPESQLKAIPLEVDCLRNFVIRAFSELRSKCEKCPDTTCRIGRSCYCPTVFLADPALQKLCQPSHTKSWDDSILLEDRHYRSCVRRPPSQNKTFDNCCAMSNPELDIRVGTSDNCPLSRTGISAYVKSLDNECDPCPYGTCRVGSHCYCPQDFLNSDDMKALCSPSFGGVHPESVGKEDTLCPANPTPEILSPSSEPTPTSSPTQPGVTPSKSATSPGTTPSIAPSADSSPGTTDPSIQPQPSSVVEADKGTNSPENSGQEDTVNLVGVVIGSVTGLISAIGVFVGWYICLRRRRKRKNADAPDEAAAADGQTQEIQNVVEGESYSDLSI